MTCVRLRRQLTSANKCMGKANVIYYSNAQMFLFVASILASMAQRVYLTIVFFFGFWHNFCKS